MPKIANITLNRGAAGVMVSLLNFEPGDSWNIYRADSYIGTLQEVIRDHDANEYLDTQPDPEQNIMYRVSLNDSPLTRSIEIIIDLSETESYVIVEPIGSAVIDTLIETFHTPWMNDDVDLTVSFIDGFSVESNLSRPMISIGVNQTL